METLYVLAYVSFHLSEQTKNLGSTENIYNLMIFLCFRGQNKYKNFAHFRLRTKKFISIPRFLYLIQIFGVQQLDNRPKNNNIRDRNLF